MKQNFKTGYLILSLLLLLVIGGCSSKTHEETKQVKLPQYIETLALEKTKEGINYYNLEKGNFTQVNGAKDVLDLSYNLDKKVYVYLLNISKGKNLNKNKIKIQTKYKTKIINNFYSAQDLKLSSKGTKIAYRTYKEDSLQSAQGLKIYNIEKDKEVKIHSKVLVSGDLYEWINEEEIIYYGAIPGKNDYTKIYKYNIKNQKEEIYMDNMEGYCAQIKSVGNNILYLERKGQYSRVCYYDYEKNFKKVISEEIEEISDLVFNSKSNEVFFIGKNNYEKLPQVYKIFLKDLNLARVTYDFPEGVSEDLGMSIDNSGNIYFCGYSTYNNFENKSQDIFMYSNTEKSINLISINSSKYKIYGYKEIKKAA